ncbi:MAG: hypothetical protein ACYCTE_16945 [Acidimicrobiales bacterium]
MSAPRVDTRKPSAEGIRDFPTSDRYDLALGSPAVGSPAAGIRLRLRPTTRRNGATMDQASAQHPQGEATPIFGAYRRGYDPDQVDRYVADQQRRLDEALQRASDSERKLAAAVGQLRELHRRVAVLESEERSPQPTPLDTLGERVQRILQEAWEGAYALRQGAEQEMAELRERTAGEAEAIVAGARQRAMSLEGEIQRRRAAYLEQVEEDRSRAVAQITHLHHRRDAALGELLKIKAVIESTVADASRPREDAPGNSVEDTGAAIDLWLEPDEVAGDGRRPMPDAGVSASSAAPARSLPASAARRALEPPATEARREQGQSDERTTALLEPADAPSDPSDPSELVRSHRAARPRRTQAHDTAMSERPRHDNGTVFDFEVEQEPEI